MATRTAIPAVELQQVTKNYGSVQALKGISLTVEPGEVVAILGPNGAGKTTAIALMIGMRRPSSGRVMLFGENPRLATHREHIGVMLQESGVPATLKVRELVELFGRLHDHPMATQEAMKMAGLEEKSNARLAQLSGGQKQRVYFALALVGNPEVLFLDEPTTGLDVESRLAFWEQITHQIAQGKTIILTTHNLEEADALARRIVVINLGQIIADGTPAEIKGHVSGKRVSFRAPHTTLEELNALVGGYAFQERGNTFELLTKDPEAVLATLSKHGVELSDLEVDLAVWAKLLGMMVLGIIPLSLLGLFLGFLGSIGLTVALSMSLLVVMSFASGIFVPLQYLPDLIQKIALYLPTYHLVQLGWSIVGSTSGDGQVWTHVLILLAYAVGFAVLAGWAYIRDGNKNFA